MSEESASGAAWKFLFQTFQSLPRKLTKTGWIFQTRFVLHGDAAANCRCGRSCAAKNAKNVRKSKKLIILQQNSYSKKTVVMREKTVQDWIQVVKNTDDIDLLYEAQIELELLKGELFKKRADGNHEEVPIMADIGLATTLQDVARERQRELAEKTKQKANQEQQFNYNFIQNSKHFISKELFDEIAESATIPRSVFRRRQAKKEMGLPVKQLRQTSRNE